MTDWIDQESTRRNARSQAQQQFWKIFTAMADRLWEYLTARLTQDADKLNQVLATEIKGPMRVNGRQQLPHRNQLFIDNLAYPAIYLDIELDSSARSIHIKQVRRECL